MEKIRVKDLLYLTGGNTKVIIGDCFNIDNIFVERWRGIVDDVDLDNLIWDGMPCSDRCIEHITVVNGEDWLQIWT